MKRVDPHLHLTNLAAPKHANPTLLGKLQAVASMSKLRGLHVPVAAASVASAASVSAASVSTSKGKGKLTKDEMIRNLINNGRVSMVKMRGGGGDGGSDAKTTSGVGYLLMLLSSVFLLTGWFGSWMDGGGGSGGGGETTPMPPYLTTTSYEMSTSAPNTPIAKYGCQFGYQGRLCDPCGVQPVAPNIKIVGGVEAVPHSWPAQALLLYSYAADVYIEQYNETVTLGTLDQFNCGGSLITRDTVLTAAQCIESLSSFTVAEYNDTYVDFDVVPNKYFPTLASRYSVVLGAHNLTAAIEGVPPATKVQAVYVQVHPEYNLDGRLLNDIAIIKLEREVELNEYIQLACLPDPTKPDYPTDYGETTYAMGWGTLEQGGNVSDTLQNVELDLLYGPTQCYPDEQSNFDWDMQICSGVLAGGKDTCQGDSGGPLFVKDWVIQNDTISEKFIEVGIVSYGPGCANPDMPGLYTRVSYYWEWIQGFL